MGSPYHHYLIADERIIPPENEIYYSERVLRVPCNQPIDRKREVSGLTPTRAQAGLPENAFVYASLNGMQKLTARGFARWITILSAVPNSVLWLLTGDEATNQRLRVRRIGKRRERRTHSLRPQGGAPSSPGPHCVSRSVPRYDALRRAFHRRGRAHHGPADPDPAGAELRSAVLQQRRRRRGPRRPDLPHSRGIRAARDRVRPGPSNPGQVSRPIAAQARVRAFFAISRRSRAVSKSCFGKCRANASEARCLFRI